MAVSSSSTRLVEKEPILAPRSPSRRELSLPTCCPRMGSSRCCLGSEIGLWEEEWWAESENGGELALDSSSRVEQGAL